MGRHIIGHMLSSGSVSSRVICRPDFAFTNATRLTLPLRGNLDGRREACRVIEASNLPEVRLKWTRSSADLVAGVEDSVTAARSPRH